MNINMCVCVLILEGGPNLPGGMWLITWAFLHIVALVLLVLDPPLTREHVLELLPWWGAGGIAYALFQVFDSPEYLAWIEPAFTLSTVYMTLPAIVGAVWLVMIGVKATTGRPERIGVSLGVMGSILLFALLGVLAWVKPGPTMGFASLWPMIIGLFASVLLTGLVYTSMSRLTSSTVEVMGVVGATVIFAHVFNGFSTYIINTIGYGVLGVVENDVTVEIILSFASSLPTDPYIGSGWLFVLLRIGLGILPVVTLATKIEENPTRWNIVLVLITALMFGWAMNNYALVTLLQ